MTRIKADTLDDARLMFKMESPVSASPLEVKDEHVAWTLAKRYGLIKLFKEAGGKKMHIETAMRNVFPNVPWHS